MHLDVFVFESLPLRRSGRLLPVGGAVESDPSQSLYPGYWMLHTHARESMAKKSDVKLFFIFFKNPTQAYFFKKSESRIPTFINLNYDNNNK